MSIKAFLEEIAEQVYSNYDKNLGEVKLVFPNRRAGLFFRKFLAAKLSKPIWSPQVLSLEDFVGQYSHLRKADRFALIVELYKSYSKYLGNTEQFDRFFYWGEMLLNDFDDIDKYLIDTEILFTDVSRQKELDDYFDYLTDDQRKIIKEFWNTLEQNPSKEKANFREIWNKLHDIYTDFRSNLKAKNLAYSGMVFREVVDSLPTKIESPIIFAGFNALTTSEEHIVSHFLKEGAQIVWDLDSHYMENEYQEAGHFLREYRGKTVFEKSLKPPYPNNINTHENPIQLYSVAQQIGQVKLLGQLLSDELNKGGFELEKTAIVLPDESLLFPLLNSLPKSIDQVNVTMGFPLASTPIYNLMEHLFSLQIRSTRSKDLVYFSPQETLYILQHSLVQDIALDEANLNIKNIKEGNWFKIEEGQLVLDTYLLPAIFKKVDSVNDLMNYLQDIITRLAKAETATTLEKEYAAHFYKQINRIAEVIHQFKLQLDIEAFGRLFKQFVRSMRIPFSGEPLNGLQIMGVLETRNLDFDNVYVLSMNEGLFPSPGRGHSFVPYNLRKAYGLPTHDQQDSIYAYLFYRLLQKAKNVCLIYNSEVGKTGGGEQSRFIQQLRYESNRRIEEKNYAPGIKLSKARKISIDKTENVFEKLSKYVVKEGVDKQSRFTPSALNTYLDCRLRFYFKYVAELYEQDELQHEIDPMVFGNLLHNSLELIYKQLLDEDSGNEITNKKLHRVDQISTQAIRRVFKEHYSIKAEKFKITGKRLLAFEMIKKYVNRVLKLDADYAPFEIIGLEAKDYNWGLPIETDSGQIQIGLKGIIDRIDRKGERIRILDYKTGKDNRKFDSIASLFEREDKNRNKAAMQTLFYSLLFVRNNRLPQSIIPGIINTRELFGRDFDYRLITGGEPIVNVVPHLAEFEGHLKDLLSEIYSPFIPFDQTDDEKKCSSCPYNSICRR